MFRRILLWFAATLLISFVGFVLTSYVVSQRSSYREPMMRRVSNFQLEEGVRAYQRGGQAALRDYMARLNAGFPADHYLVDRSGRDLVTGENRQQLLERAAAAARSYSSWSWWWSWNRPRHLLIRRATADGNFSLIIQNEFPAPDPWANLATYGWIVLVIVLLTYALASTLAKPIRRLRQTVMQFGAGDLATRTHSKRRDEIGDLERAFDEMAGRIETLLTAERRLLQDISHELRSPLARLRFALELVKSSPDPKAAVQRAQKEVDRLAVLVNELLQVTRAEGDPESRTRASISLGQFLESLVEDCRIEAAASGCSIRLELQNPATLTGDPELLHRAVENVVRNAIQHSPAGSEILVRLSASGEEVVITVQDEGRGVADQHLTEIFRPFYRVEEDRSRTNGGGGVGLGLSIAERAVRVHRGEIRASNANPGLRVELRLPQSPA